MTAEIYKNDFIYEGIAIGEKNKAIETAKKMLHYGDSIEKVCDVTGLFIEEINKLKQN